MTKINNYLRVTFLILACLFVQACSEGRYYFLITNTKSGNVCVENFELSATDPYALKVSKILYARYGEGEGEKKMYAGTIGGTSACDKLTEYDAPRPNLIISVEFYKTVIEPEYLALPGNTKMQ